MIIGYIALVNYVRTHKVTTVHRAAIGYRLGDMKTSYLDLYLDVLAKFEDFNENLLINAL